MRHLFAAVLALVLLAGPSAAADKECQTATYDELKAQNKHHNPVYMAASKHGFDKILAFVNAKRVEKKLPMLDADSQIVGFFNADGRTLVGVVMFKDDCLVHDSFKVMPVAEWVAFMMDAGVSPQDFARESGS